MDKEEKDIKEMYDKLSEGNKDIVNMIAQAMSVAEENAKKGNN